MITWKRNSDLYFVVTFLDGFILDYDIEYKIFTTNKYNAPAAKYNRDKKSFINCEINRKNPSELIIYFNRPDLRAGKLNIEMSFKKRSNIDINKPSKATCVLDRVYEIKNDIYIIN